MQTSGLEVDESKPALTGPTVCLALSYLLSDSWRPGEVGVILCFPDVEAHWRVVDFPKDTQAVSDR